MPTPHWSSRFAGGSTACHWRSSSPHLVSRCSALKALPPAWTTAYRRLPGRRRRPAESYRRLFARAEAEAPTRATADWLTGYALEIDNLRAALDWAFSPTGEASTGVALTASAFPLWSRLSLLEECRGRAQQALGALGTASTEDPRETMRLYAALGASTSEASEMEAAFTGALDIARRLGDREY